MLFLDCYCEIGEECPTELINLASDDPTSVNGACWHTSRRGISSHVYSLFRTCCKASATGHRSFAASCFPRTLFRLHGGAVLHPFYRHTFSRRFRAAGHRLGAYSGRLRGASRCPRIRGRLAGGASTLAVRLAAVLLRGTAAGFALT